MATSKTTRINLTKAAIQSLSNPTSGRKYIYDAKTPGLAICVTAAGSKTWYVYRKVDGKPERIRIGPWPDWNVTRARDEAARLNGKIAVGENPNDKTRQTRGAPTLAELFDDFIELPTRTKAKRPKSAKTVKDYRLQFDKYLGDWHNRSISKIKRIEIEQRHNRLADENGVYTANRVLSLVKALYNTAIDLGHYNENPAARLRAFEEETRERFLQADELPRFFAALEQEPSVKVRDFIKIALFTGQRRSNVLAMRWSDIHLGRKTWTLPATKTGKHVVPLTDEAVEILKRRKENAGGGDYVFPGRHGAGHLTDPMRQWRELLERAGIEDLRLHDLRRSLGSWQTITGSSIQVVGKTLGHSRPETTAIYGRLSDDPVRQSMATATAAMLAAAKPKAKEDVDG